MRGREHNRCSEDGENHERWLVSYADFITLLFAFFVVMYAISQQNEGGFQDLTGTLNKVFSVQEIEEQEVVTPIEAVSMHTNALEKIDKILQDVEEQKPELEMELVSEYDPADQLIDITSRIEENTQLLIAKGLMSVKRSNYWVEIELQNEVLFASGSAQLSVRALPVLGELAKVLSSEENSLMVSGFTDNIPIDNDEFISNWELSAARAASVVRFLSRKRVSPKRMVVVGHGEFRPIADNRTRQGRKANRRIKIVLFAYPVPDDMIIKQKLANSIREP